MDFIGVAYIFFLVSGSFDDDVLMFVFKFKWCMDGDEVEVKI